MGLIVCPSRELARQTQEVIVGYLEALRGDGAPELRSLLVMGGIDMRQQARPHFCAFVRGRNGRCNGAGYGLPAMSAIQGLV